jgi:hypothetical protein
VITEKGGWLRTIIARREMLFYGSHRKQIRIYFGKNKLARLPGNSAKNNKKVNCMAI